MTTCRLAIFARVPARGLVKTRLAEVVGVDRALEIYEALLAATLRKFAPGEGCFEPEIWVAGDIDAFAHWQHRTGMRSLGHRLVAQSNGDLGERMARAFDDGVRVLVGTDIPAMTAGYVEQALDALRNSDVVLGPTEDGGYCLIGMNSSHPKLFHGIPWSTAGVLASTLRAAENLRVRLLDELWDVDDDRNLARMHSTTSRDR